MQRVLILLLLTVAVCRLQADLGPAMAESNLEKRSRLALENADQQMNSVDKAYDAGNGEKMLAALEEMRASVDLAIESLKQSGKNPRRGGKYFKNAEIRTRKLVRRIENLRRRMIGEERIPIEKLRDHVQRVHDELLDAILGRTKWR